ncbi:hypothetical protein F4679DRAFT_534866 [Xylaria curta]|nr:hypothetical protein F4679DRAFT_534866 [Xylaria curta]
MYLGVGNSSFFFFVLDTLPVLCLVFFFAWSLSEMDCWVLVSHKRAQQSTKQARGPDGFGGTSRKHPELVLSSGRSSHVVVASVAILSLLSFVL